VRGYISGAVDPYVDLLVLHPTIDHRLACLGYQNALSSDGLLDQLGKVALAT
jgi:hypothetical protein